MRETRTAYKAGRKEIIFLVEESNEGGYEAKALDCSIFTQAETIKELKEAIKDAIECHFEGKSKPHIVRIHMVKDEVMVV
ncbi:MAG: 2-oxoisovalerate dehydrogenase [Elusimicrobia bacterium]|nr:2-oxoisovalerate dehydrogenase [Elusimicrobiota bacterium]